MSKIKPKAGLLIVDMQNDFINQDGALYVPGATGIQRNVLRICDLFIQAKQPIVATMDWHEKDDVEFKKFPAHCVKDTFGAELYKPLYPDEIIKKQTISVFDNPEASKVFEQQGVKLWYVCGVATEYCVKMAVLGLLERGYKVIIIGDAIKGINEVEEESTLQELIKAGAELIPHFEEMNI